MRTILFLLTALATNAGAAAPLGAAPQAQIIVAQPLATKPPAANATTAPIPTKQVANPKIQEAIATRNADGSQQIGCVERLAAPSVAKPPVSTIAPGTQR